MSRRNITAIGFGIGALFILATIGAAGADEPLKLRWNPVAGTPTELSGVPEPDDADYYEHVRINPTMSTKPEDRYYAIRGIRTAGGSSHSISVVPAFLHPNADRNVSNSWFGYSDTSNMKTAELPEGYYLTSVQVCDNGETAYTDDIRGLRVWGHKLDSLGRTINPTGPVEFTRTNCKRWRTKVSCPSGKIAHSLRWYDWASIALVCAKAEPAVGAWNPWSGTVLDGGQFRDATGKIHVTLQAKNESHTTGNVTFADAKLMSGGTPVCQVTTGSGPSIPYGHTQDIALALPCDWQKIKTAGGCKLGDSCSVKLKGVIKAKVEGLVEEHPYETTVTIKHVP